MFFELFSFPSFPSSLPPPAPLSSAFPLPFLFCSSFPLPSSSFPSALAFQPYIQSLCPVLVPTFFHSHHLSGKGPVLVSGHFLRSPPPPPCRLPSEEKY